MTLFILKVVVVATAAILGALAAHVLIERLATRHQRQDDQPWNSEAGLW